MDYKELADRFRELLESHRKVTVVSHIRPDGDTVGSSIALFNSLKLMGYQAELVCQDSDLPLKLNFLDGFKRYKSKIDYSDSLVVTLDCGESKRAGFSLHGRVVVNIDHHISNSQFGVLNIVEVEVATAAVLFKLLKEGFAMNKDVAEALYSALLSDSLNFTSTLVNRNTFDIASELLGYGLDPSYIAQMVNRRESLAHTRLIARAIDSLELLVDATVAVMVITKEDRLATGAKVSDIDGIVNFALNLVTVEIALLIVELDDRLKVSLRSKGKNVARVARSFGGGGHENAAGFEAKNVTIEELKIKIIEKIKEEVEYEKS